MSTEQKKSIREIVLNEKERAVKYVDNFIATQKNIENHYDKFFKEISKHSEDFEILKKKTVITKDVIYRHNNGKTTVVSKVSKEYNECYIKFIGKLPEGNRNTINIRVEEHIKYSRSRWGRTNEGFKLVLSFDYDTPIYYKTGKGLVKRVEEFVSSKWENYNFEIESLRKKNLIKDSIKKRFPNFTINETNNSNMFKVYLNNNTEVYVSCNLNYETENVTFYIEKINFLNRTETKNKVDDIINSLVNI
jgi:hypothetical protein